MINKITVALKIVFSGELLELREVTQVNWWRISLMTRASQRLAAANNYPQTQPQLVVRENPYGVLECAHDA